MIKKRILIITPGFLPLLGGMENQVYTISQEFIARGYGVDVVTERTTPDFLPFEILDGIEVYRLPKPNRNGFFGYFGFMSALSKFLISCQKNYDFAMIRTFTVQGLVAGGLKFLRLFRLPTVITCDTGGENDELDLIINSRFKGLFKFVFSQHNYLNALCENNLRKFQILGFDQKKLVKIYNGLDLSGYVRAKYPEKIFNFLFLGQLLRQKGLYELLEAMRIVTKNQPKVKLYIAGDGVEKVKMLSYIKTHGLKKNIIYLGRIYPQQKKDFFAKGQCLVLPSYSESFGLVIAEAAINKRYIICTDVADIKKIYPDALICKKRSAEDLAKKMLGLVAKPTKKINYDQAMKLIDIHKTAVKFINLFSS